MSDVTVLSSCEIDDFAVRLCNYLEKILGKSLYTLIEDDYRRPIVDGVLSSLVYYQEVDFDKIREILEKLGYSELYNALKKAYRYALVEDAKTKITELTRDIEERIFNLI